MTAPTGKKPRYFYGWNIVAASFLANLSYAEQHASMLGLFFRPFQREFGWSRSAMAGAHTVSRVVEALVATYVGPLVDRYGPRILMPIGATIVGCAMVATTQIDAIWEFYLLRGLVVGIGYTLMGALVTDVSVNNWFIRKRGRAIAIARSGASASNVILTPIAVFVIAASGWRTMFIVFAAITWLFVIIPPLVLMRRRPEDMGLKPDGIDADDGEAWLQEEKTELAGQMTSNLGPTWTRRQVLATGSFWLLATSFTVSSLAFQAINISLIPYIQDLGHGDAMVASVVTFRAVLMGTATLLMGFVSEYAQKPSIRVLPFVVQGAGTVLFLLAGEPIFLWLAVSAYGLGFSCAAIIQEVVWADYFGRVSLGLVRSLGYFITFGVGAIGPVAMNFVFDVLGSYRPSFMVLAGLFVLAAFLIALSRPPKAQGHPN